jgi:integrase
MNKILIDRAEQQVPLKDPIFPWSESTAYRHCKRAAEKAGIDCAPHAFRAAAATMLKSDGLEDREVAEFLRHKTITMVQVYDHRYREANRKTKNCLENFSVKLKKSG